MGNEIKMYRGDNYSRKMVVYDSKDIDIRSTVDITGALITFSLKNKKNDTSYIFQRKNLAAGGDATQIEMSDPTNGEFTLHIVPSNTQTETPGTFHYDFEMTLSGFIKTIADDILHLDEDTTRP